ncbi:hypothetical protein [Halomonas piscis]|uniref:hypothetical protein n=1 Tax=Halomonas piscis TaxID=3031727 RepID=UPI00289D2E6B|nr:hypothetical protein [Halomonas piscis]
MANPLRPDTGLAETALREGRIATGESPWQTPLRLYQDAMLSVYYAPMEYVTLDAKVVLCGITPGATQVRAALANARQVLDRGGTIADARRTAKRNAVFIGLRESIAAMLDAVGLNRRLKIATCASLFGDNADLLHCTNALRHPVVLASGRGYNGTPAPHHHAYLNTLMRACLHEEIRTLGERALWLPLGRAAAAALKRAREAGLLTPEQLLDGLPHPSGANRERILYFTGQKSRAALSRQTNPEMLDAAKAALTGRIRRG